jgi:hypothetical protein
MAFRCMTSKESDSHSENAEQIGDLDLRIIRTSGYIASASLIFVSGLSTIRSFCVSCYSFGGG